MDNLHDLFLHELRDLYDAEKRAVKALATMKGHVTDKALKKAFTEHEEETEGHVERLERVFELFDEEPEAETCAGFKGLVDEHDRFMKEGPSQEISNVYHVWAGVKAERYEVSAYESLIELADRMARPDVAEVLEETLAEEEAALERLLDLSTDVKLEEAAAR